MYGLCIVCRVFLFFLFYTYIGVAREFKTLQQGVSLHRSWLSLHRSLLIGHRSLLSLHRSLLSLHRSWLSRRAVIRGRQAVGHEKEWGGCGEWHFVHQPHPPHANQYVHFVHL